MVTKPNVILKEMILAVQISDGVVEIQKAIAIVKVVWITGEVAELFFLCFISCITPFILPLQPKMGETSLCWRMRIRHPLLVGF